MAAKTILTVLFLISLGVVVILGLRALPQRGDVDTGARDEILVTTAALPPGALLRAKDVVWHLSGTAEPGQIVRPAGAAGKANTELDQQARAEVYGAALRAGVSAGDPIRRSAIVKPGDRDFLQIVLSPRARAIAIPVATGGASTGLLYPGDHVDVILTQTFKNDPPLTRRSVSETVVEGLRVLAIDAADIKSTPGSSGFGRTVTLEVTSQQAERINVATELGKLSLVLRSNSASRASPSLMSGSLKIGSVAPVWAGDVSPALSEERPQKASDAIRQAVDVIRGTKSVAVKGQ